MAAKRPSKTKATGKRSRLIKRSRAALAILLLVVAIVLGLAASFRMGRNSAVAPPALASQAEIFQAKQDITTAYLASSIKSNCVDPMTNMPYDGVAYFNKYLAVNAYADRAIIRPCNSGGELLAKLNGKWVATQVNLNIDTRANPIWAKACWASDILVPDTVVRPENNSIDAGNLQQCLALQHGKNLDIFGKEIKE